MDEGYDNATHKIADIESALEQYLDEQRYRNQATALFSLFLSFLSLLF